MKKNYRVFMTRYFLNCKSFEVKADSAKDARRLAEKAGNKIYNPYELLFKSTDNGFCDIDATEINRLGYQIDDKTKPFAVKKVFKNEKGTVYIDARRDES